MNDKLKLALYFAAVLILVLSGAPSVLAAPPADPCSLLPASQLQKTLGQSFAEPEKTRAPAPYRGMSAGTQCHYTAQKGRDEVVFIVYVDASASEAKQAFEKLSTWFPAKSKESIGDMAYIDRSNAIHVLKDKVRYYISLDPVNEKQLLELANSVLGRM